VFEQAPVTVGEVSERYGVPNQISRSTVVTVMERLRKKGYLERTPGADGVFRYHIAPSHGEVTTGLVARFVERTLAGSLAPLTAYFVGKQKLTEEEAAQLSRLLEKLETESKSSDNKEAK
jgi:predicted transcriptional regulator